MEKFTVLDHSETADIVKVASILSTAFDLSQRQEIHNIESAILSPFFLSGYYPEINIIS